MILSSPTRLFYPTTVKIPFSGNYNLMRFSPFIHKHMALLKTKQNVHKDNRSLRKEFASYTCENNGTESENWWRGRGGQTSLHSPDSLVHGPRPSQRGQQRPPEPRGAQTRRPPAAPSRRSGTSDVILWRRTDYSDVIIQRRQPGKCAAIAIRCY